MISRNNTKHFMMSEIKYNHPHPFMKQMRENINEVHHTTPHHSGWTGVGCMIEQAKKQRKNSKGGRDRERGGHRQTNKQNTRIGPQIGMKQSHINYE